MAKRYKKKWIQNEESEMIEHSIKKHQAPTTSSVVYLPQSRQQHNNYPPSTRTTWTKGRCEHYIEDLKNRGFTIGKKVVTVYNSEATIDGYRIIPEQGLDFLGNTVPHVITIKRFDTNLNNGIFYSENELTLSGE